MFLQVIFHKQKNENKKKNELNASKFKIMYILFLSVDADIFSLLD